MAAFSRPPPNNGPIAAQKEAPLVFRVARLRFVDSAEQFVERENVSLLPATFGEQGTVSQWIGLLHFKSSIFVCGHLGGGFSVAVPPIGGFFRMT